MSPLPEAEERTRLRAEREIKKRFPQLVTDVVAQQIIDDDGRPDWRRVTIDGRGLKVHNAPKWVTLDEIAEPVRPSRAPKRGARTASAASAPRAPATPSPAEVAARIHTSRSPIVTPLRAPVAPAFVMPPPPVTPAPPVADAGPSTTPTEGVDPDLSAYEASIELATGIPLDVPVTIADWIVDYPGYDAGIVDAVMCKPDRVEVDPETAVKGYPVLRFWKGDVCVVVMFPSNAEPFVPAWYATTKAMNNWTGPRALTGGGGPRRSVGMPTRPRQLIKRLTRMGAEVREVQGEAGTLKGQVTYMGQDVGDFRIEGAYPHETELNWQRLSRKIHAIYQRHLAGKLSPQGRDT